MDTTGTCDEGAVGPRGGGTKGQLRDGGTRGSGGSKTNPTKYCSVSESPKKTNLELVSAPKREIARTHSELELAAAEGVKSLHGRHVLRASSVVCTRRLNAVGGWATLTRLG